MLQYVQKARENPKEDKSMKVKKVFALLLAATMVLGMTACGDSDKERAVQTVPLYRKAKEARVKPKIH